MNNTFDIGAFVLYVIYVGVITLLVYILFDIKNIFGKSKIQRYISGHPGYQELESPHGILEIEGEKVSFKESALGKEYFSIPLREINNVATYRGEPSSKSPLKGVSNIFDEREYLTIGFHHDGEWHKVQFSNHKSSPVGNEVKENIINAKNRIRGNL